MKTFKQLLAVSVMICGTLLISSCTDEISSDNSELVTGSVLSMTNTEIKKEFGKALAKVLAESAPVRELIKKEALKKIDYDYDVLYLMVKDEVLSDNNTLEGLLLEYLNSDFLNLVESRIPNLTIFVPELPEDSFSAELWNFERDIPDVGIRAFDVSGVPAYNVKSGEYLIASCDVPQYPIVVIKENERIVVNDKSLNLSGSSVNQIHTRAGKTIDLVFLDDVFNNQDDKKENMNISTKVLKSGSITPLPTNLQKISDAYDIYKGIDGWQRDYVYYDITPSNTKGPFKNNYKECIVGFELLGDPEAVFAKISDQDGDPRIKSMNRRAISWTEGEFEFMVKIYLGSISIVGSDLTTYFRAKGDDLFYSVNGTTTGRDIVAILKTKRMDLVLPLFEWNLENYSTSVKITVEEVDATQVVKNTTSTTLQFAGNFEFDPEWGTKVKKGMKLGASGKIDHTVSYEISTTMGNDELGQVIVNFGDDICQGLDTVSVGRGGRYSDYEVVPNYNSKYFTGWYRLYIAPLKMD